MLPDRQRVAARQPGISVGPLELKTGNLTASAEVHDVSVMGLGLVMEREYPTGTVFTIESGPFGRKPPRDLTLEVRHAMPHENGRWRIGCVFSRLLIADDLDAMGSM